MILPPTFNRRQQRGVALISVLLIVVVATVLGVAMSREQNYAITRARLFLEQSRVQQYAMGGEELARQILHADFVDAPQKDTLVETWAQRGQTFEFEDGEVHLRIEDLQGRFNLNALSDAATNNLVARAQLTNLLLQQGLDPSLVDRVADWIDNNQTVRPFGAEDFDYLGLERPYRTSGGLLADSSELRLLLDMAPDTLAVLLPLVSTLPDPNAGINVNTAAPALLQALAPALTAEQAEALADSRQGIDGYDNVQAFMQDDALAGQNIPVAGLSVQSGYFQVSIRARYQARFGYLTSIIQRDATDGSLYVIYRDISKKVYPDNPDSLDNPG